MSPAISVSTVGRIAANVFKESVRDKVLYNIVLFAVLLIAASLLLGQLTAGQEVKIIKDLGLAAISLFGHVHRDLHRHRPGVEGSRAAQHLRAPRQADEPHRARPRQVLGLVSTLTVNVVGDDGGAGIVLAVYEALTPEEVRRAWEAPATDRGSLSPRS